MSLAKRIIEKALSAADSPQAGASPLPIRGAVNCMFPIGESLCFVDAWLAAPDPRIKEIYWVDGTDRSNSVQFQVYYLQRQDVENALRDKIPQSFQCRGYRLMIDSRNLSAPKALEFLLMDGSKYLQKVELSREFPPAEQKKRVLTVPSSYGVGKKLTDDQEYRSAFISHFEKVMAEEEEKQPIKAYVDHWYLMDNRNVLAAGWIDDGGIPVEEMSILDCGTGEKVENAMLFRHFRGDVTKGKEELGYLIILPWESCSDKTITLRYEQRSLPVVLRMPPKPSKPMDILTAVILIYNNLYLTGLFRKESHASLDRLLTSIIDELCAANRKNLKVDEDLWIGKPPESPTVSIVIPVYQSYELLRYQVSDLSAGDFVSRQEIIYVLDSVEDAEWFKVALRSLHNEYFLPLRILIMSHNGGFAEACNAGARAARAPYILFMNSDVFPKEPRWLETMLSNLEQDESVGIVGARLLFYDETIQHVGLTWDICDDPAMHGLLLNIHPYKGMSPSLVTLPGVQEVQAVTAACMLCRKKDVEAVGLFNVGYVRGDFEDSDFCLRIRQLGKKIVCDNRAVLYHLEGESYPSHIRQQVFVFNARRHEQLWGDTIAEMLGWHSVDLGRQIHTDVVLEQISKEANRM